MKYFSLIFLLFSLNVLVVSGQKRDYYVSDSNILSVNVVLYEGSEIENSEFCHVKKDDQVIRYSPDEIKEYGFKDGRVYVAREISMADSTHKVFLERLVDGKSKLYYYGGRGTDMFFLEKEDGTLALLPKKDYKGSYRDILAEFTYDCPKISSNSKFVAYKKKIMSNYLREYNECKSLHLPMLRFGVFAGMAHTKPVETEMPPEIKGNFTYDPENNLYFGLFLNMPISASDFSLYSSIGFFESSYTSSLSTYDYDAGILIEQSSLVVPVLLRYTLTTGRIQPFINIGINYLYNLKNENTIYKASDINNTVQFEYIKQDLFSDHEVGCTFGAGVQYEINFKRMIFIDLKLNREFSVDKAQSIYNLNLVELTSGINF